MGTVLNKRELPVVDEMIKLLKSLTQEEQQEINIFIRGIKFAQRTGMAQCPTRESMLS